MRIKLLILVTILFLTGIHCKTSAQDWNFTSTEILFPINIAVSSSGEKTYMSFDSRNGLWCSEEGQFSNLDMEFIEYNRYQYGDFYKIGRSDSFVLNATRCDREGNDLFFFSDESENWTSIEEISGCRIERLYVDPDSTTIFIYFTFDDGEEFFHHMWMTQDNFASHTEIEQQYTTRFFRAGNDYYSLYNIGHSGVSFYQVIRYNPEINNWDINNPVFDTYDHIPENPTDISSVYSLQNGEILISGSTRIGIPYIPYNMICNSNWEFIEWIEDEDLDDVEFSSFLEDRFNPGSIYAVSSSDQKLFHSADNGRNWDEYRIEEMPEYHARINTIYQQPETGDIFISIINTGLYKSSDHGASWERIDVPDIHGNIAEDEQIDFYHGTILTNINNHACLSCNDLLWHIFDGTNWIKKQVPQSEDVVIEHEKFFYINADTLLGQVSMYDSNNPIPTYCFALSTDNGSTWSYFDDLFSKKVFPYYTENNVRLYSQYIDNLEYSEDLGQTWQEISLTSSVFAQNDNYFYSTEDNSSIVVRRAVSGGYWEDMFFPADRYCVYLFSGSESIFAISPAYENIYTIFSYQDGAWFEGGQIEAIAPPLNMSLNFPSLVIDYEDETIFFSTSNYEGELRASRDCGITWEAIDFSFPFEVPRDFSAEALHYDRSSNTVWVNTEYGLFWSPLEDMLDVEDSDVFYQPVTHCLLSNYPNPFNASTRIQYHLTQPGNVKLDVYDITGRLVQTLKNTYQPAGRQNIFFDGSALASGTYFIQLNTGTETRYRRITLVK